MKERPEPVLDGDGYPSDEQLEAIKTWEIIGSPLNEFLDYCRVLWLYPDRWVDTDGDLYLSTGGWSGNEAVLGAMQENFIFWAMCWRRHDVGGHYWFNLNRWIPKSEAQNG